MHSDLFFHGVLTNENIETRSLDYVEAGTSYYNTLSQCCFGDPDGTSQGYLDENYAPEYANKDWMGQSTACGLALDMFAENLAELPENAAQLRKEAVTLSAKVFNQNDEEKCARARKEWIQKQVWSCFTNVQFCSNILYIINYK